MGMSDFKRWTVDDPLLISTQRHHRRVPDGVVDKERFIAMEEQMFAIEVACYPMHNSNHLRATLDIRHLPSGAESPLVTREEMIAELQRRYAAVGARVWVDDGLLNIDAPPRRFFPQPSRAHMGTSRYRSSYRR